MAAQDRLARALFYREEWFEAYFVAALLAAWAAVAREEARDVVVEQSVRTKLERTMTQGDAERREEVDRDFFLCGGY